MKLNKIVLLLAVALVASLAVTGCKKGPIKTTVIPGNQPTIGEGGPGTTIPDTKPFGDQNPPPTLHSCCMGFIT